MNNNNVRLAEDKFGIIDIYNTDSSDDSSGYYGLTDHEKDIYGTPPLSDVPRSTPLYITPEENQKLKEKRLRDIESEERFQKWVKDPMANVPSEVLEHRGRKSPEFGKEIKRGPVEQQEENWREKFKRSIWRGKRLREEEENSYKEVNAMNHPIQGGSRRRRRHAFTVLASNEIKEFYKYPSGTEGPPFVLQAQRETESDSFRENLSNELYRVGIPESKGDFTEEHKRKYEEIKNNLIQTWLKEIDRPWNTQSGEGGGRRRKTRKKCRIFRKNKNKISRNYIMLKQCGGGKAKMGSKSKPYSSKKKAMRSRRRVCYYKKKGRTLKLKKHKKHSKKKSRRRRRR